MQAISTEQEVRTETSGKPRTVPMSRPEAIKLVDLLATSDEFRDVFMRDARMALETWQFDQEIARFLLVGLQDGYLAVGSEGNHRRGAR